MAGITGDGTWTVGESWPWPQVVFTDYYVLGFAIIGDNLHLCELYCGADDIWVSATVQDLGTVATISWVDVAEFGMFYVVSVWFAGTPTATAYIRNPGVGTPLIAALPTVRAPKCTTCCNFNGQAIMGGIIQDDASFGDLSFGWVAWSGIGRFDFRITQDSRAAGYRKVPWDKWGTGLVYKVAKLGNFVIVFGDGGVCGLRPYSEPTSTYGLVELPYLGVRSRNHVAGDEHQQFYIDQKDDLWRVDGELKFTKLGYREFLKPLIADTDNGPTKLSYHRQKRRLFICNGAKGYVLTEHGMYEMHQLVTSVGDYRGQYAGLLLDTTDTAIRATTTTLDFGQRALKMVGSVEVGANYYDVVGDPAVERDLEVALDYRYSYQKERDSFSRTGWKRLSPVGTAYHGVTASEFRISVRGGDYVGGSINLDYIKARIKMGDRRTIRGVYDVSKATS